MLIPPSLLLNLFVVVVMFSIGLRVSGGELVDILRKRALFVRALLANCFLIPAIGFLLVRIFPLTPDASVGILLLASPVAGAVALLGGPAGSSEIGAWSRLVSAMCQPNASPRG